jgi:hypothetical protein
VDGRRIISQGINMRLARKKMTEREAMANIRGKNGSNTLKVMIKSACLFGCAGTRGEGTAKSYRSIPCHGANNEEVRTRSFGSQV